MPCSLPPSFWFSSVPGSALINNYLPLLNPDPVPDLLKSAKINTSYTNNCMCYLPTLVYTTDLWDKTGSGSAIRPNANTKHYRTVLFTILFNCDASLVTTGYWGTLSSAKLATLQASFAMRKKKNIYRVPHGGATPSPVEEKTEGIWTEHLASRLVESYTGQPPAFFSIYFRNSMNE